ncbi:hypothetical protein V9T40_012010 [Parthenolecanium corni]|uniref:Ig-like domain-containing protein n=1 Tax=Parthenolecanium corni TaxID=536013 RepID=A0AAN9T7W3_9HEMI
MSMQIFYVIFCIYFMYPFVNLQRSPTISYISQVQIKDIGSSVDFACSVHDSEDYQVYWKKVDPMKALFSIPLTAGIKKLINDPRIHVSHIPQNSTYLLHIEGIQETDAGFYRCQILISSTTKPVTAEVELEVRRPPIIFDNSTRAVVTIEGLSVTLACYAGGHPSPIISWRRENNMILSNGHAVYRGNKLHIDSVHKDHHGIYYCVAENGVGRGQRRNIDVEVQFAPIVNATRKRVGQALQQDMDLECKVEAYPPPAIVWVKDGVQIANNQHWEVSHSTTSDQITSTVVRVITIEKRQYGNYTCKATNIFGESEARIELFETIIPMCPPACGGRNY